MPVLFKNSNDAQTVLHVCVDDVLRNPVEILLDIRRGFSTPQSDQALRLQLITASYHRRLNGTHFTQIADDTTKTKVQAAAFRENGSRNSLRPPIDRTLSSDGNSTPKV